MTMNLVVNSSAAREAGKRTRGNWWPDVAAAYFIFSTLKRRDAASPSQSSCCKRTTNEATPFICDSSASKAMNIVEGVRRGVVAQHDERRCKTMRATRFRRGALFAERPRGTGKKVKDREIDVAPWFCTGPCASKAANHWQATAPRRAPRIFGSRGGLCQ